MALWFLFIALAVSADTLSFNTSAKVIGDPRVKDRQLGFFSKSVNQGGDFERVRQNAVVSEPAKMGYRSGGSAKDDSSDKTMYVIVGQSVVEVKEEERPKDPVNGRAKNDTDMAVPLHVANSARQQCVDGYEADENGTCQKALPPKGEKSLKLRRRKRAEQRLSYADVVKYGKNPPKHLLTTTTTKLDVLTTVAKSAATTPPSPRLGATTPTPRTTTRGIAVTGRAGPETTVKPAVTPKATAKPAAVTSPAASPKAVTQAPKAPVTVKPAVIATTARPATRPPSKFGDINQAFLSVEKSAVVAQSVDGKVKAPAVPDTGKKAIDPTRLRRWVMGGVF